jgi:hypothetical protein
MRFRAVIAIASLVLLVGAAVADAAGPPAKAGSILIFVTPSEANGDGSIIITGATGDYGKTTSPNKQGIARAFLKQGSFEVNLSVLDKRGNNASPALADHSSCSAVFKVSGPVTILDGTGAYKGISGHATINETVAMIGPRFAAGAEKGLCNMTNSANPLAQWGAVTGSGTVSFG